MDLISEPVDQTSSPQTKIALFRSLFRGREDVYPRRFESRKTGRSGYAPACANEWVRGVCEKPRIKCAECPNRRFLPVTDDVIRWHLSGSDAEGQPFVAGVYPLFQDETCLFLAVDFDKAGWREDATAFLETCRHLDFPAALERSRSGRGAHVWFFFEEAIPAALARRLGSLVLTETMERRPDIGLDSYDRLFPNQDTMPQGGFGNLIALPLQRAARKQDNTVFLDSAFVPWADQWARFSRVWARSVGRRLNRSSRTLNAEAAFSACGCHREMTERQSLGRHLRHVIAGNRRSSGNCRRRWNLSWAIRSTSPKKACIPGFGIACCGWLRFRTQSLQSSGDAAFDVWQVARRRMREDLPRHIGLPRGCLDDVRKMLSELGVRMVIRDERHDGRPLDAKFHGELRQEQKTAADAILRHETGVLAATTAFGKTVVAAWLIAQRGVNALVLVHRRQLLDQWVERLSTFLDVPAKAIGRIGGGRSRPTGRIDVGIIQSLVRKGVVADLVADYGHGIIDECHHLSAHSFEQVARQAQARFVLGLSATVARKDDHLHAVRSSSTSGQCPCTGGVSPLRAFRARSAHSVPAGEKP
jgi:hypothetical protein